MKFLVVGWGRWKAHPVEVVWSHSLIHSPYLPMQGGRGKERGHDSGLTFYLTCSPHIFISPSAYTDAEQHGASRRHLTRIPQG